MNSSCTPSFFQLPSLPGAHVTTLDAILVQNYTRTANSLLYYGHPTVDVENATFCNVTVTYTHIDAGEEVHIETWLPVGNYNGRLQSIGGGGWVAGRYAPSFAAMAGAIGEGYATSTTDAGLLQQANLGPDRWALDDEGQPNYHSLGDLASISLNDQVSLQLLPVSFQYLCG
jgi:hypothetical protein